MSQPKCMACGAAMEPLAALYYCPVFDCEDFGHGYTRNEIDNANDAACEARDEQRAADGSQFFTALPYHTEKP